MLPYLLPICLFIYGEFSKGRNTRFISRILFYTYTLSVLFPLYSDTSKEAILLAMMILITGIGYCIATLHSIFGKAALCVALVSSVLNYIALYLQDYTFLQTIPYYVDYSHLIFRESLILGISVSSIEEKLETHDFKLEFYIALLWAYEHLII